MSIRKIKGIFENVATCEAWSLQLLQIKNSKRNGTTYCGREITLSPEGTLTNFLSEISDRYCSQEKGLEKMFERVTDYDGSTVDKTIYKLTTSNELISTEYPALIEAIRNPDSEADPLEFSAQAYILKGVISYDGEELSVKLISMLYRKFLKSSEMVYNELEIKNDMTKERMCWIRHDVVYEVFCFGLGYLHYLTMEKE